MLYVLRESHAVANQISISYKRSYSENDNCNIPKFRIPTSA